MVISNGLLKGRWQDGATGALCIAGILTLQMRLTIILHRDGAGG
jgi:hypothetical protein